MNKEIILIHNLRIKELSLSSFLKLVDLQRYHPLDVQMTIQDDKRTRFWFTKFHQAFHFLTFLLGRVGQVSEDGFDVLFSFFLNSYQCGNEYSV